MTRHAQLGSMQRGKICGRHIVRNCGLWWRKQWMSWLSLDDEIYAIPHLLMNGDSKGVYNLTAPNPSRQKGFAKTLGRVLGRPAFAPLPGFVVRILFGEMGVKLTLESQKVLPNRLLEEGFEFLHPELEGALTDTLGAWRDLKI